MPSTNSVDGKFLDEPGSYFTSSDMKLFDSVLADVLAELEQDGELDGLDGARNTLRLRLGAAIFRQAATGNRDPAILKRAALQSSLDRR